jgi:GcrA cell cycle regulator
MTSLPPFWTRSRIEELRRLIVEGFSAREIANQWGVSRNAVIGKAQRENIKRDPGVPSRTGKKPRIPNPDRPATIRITKQRQVIRRAPTIPLPDSEPDERAPTTQRRKLMELDDMPEFPRLCRWPYGTPGHEDFGFCCGRTKAGSYCAYHWKMSRAPYQPRGVAK